jgi:hypothetical protein
MALAPEGRVSIGFALVLTLFFASAGAHAQKLSPKWEELTAGDFDQDLLQWQGVCGLLLGILERNVAQMHIGT